MISAPFGSNTAVPPAYHTGPEDTISNCPLQGLDPRGCIASRWKACHSLTCSSHPHDRILFAAAKLAVARAKVCLADGKTNRISRITQRVIHPITREQTPTTTDKILGRASAPTSAHEQMPQFLTTPFLKQPPPHFAIQQVLLILTKTRCDWPRYQAITQVRLLSCQVFYSHI